jgi:predicted aldo/keto reductase-like oxidoreductase
VWNHEAVSTVVCDVGDLGELRECLAVAAEAEAGSLTVRDQLTTSRVRDAYQRRRPIDCASCRPCLPCPQGIDIPRVFELYNDAVMYGDRNIAARMYTEEQHHADRCNDCGLCERRCCQSPPLNIRGWLVTAHELLRGQ